MDIEHVKNIRRTIRNKAQTPQREPILEVHKRARKQVLGKPYSTIISKQRRGGPETVHFSYPSSEYQNKPPHEVVRDFYEEAGYSPVGSGELPHNVYVKLPAGTHTHLPDEDLVQEIHDYYHTSQPLHHVSLQNARGHTWFGSGDTEEEARAQLTQNQTSHPHGM